MASVLLEMEGERDGGAAWPTALPKPTNVAGPSLCRESGLFRLLMGELHTEEAKRMGSHDRKRFASAWSLKCAKRLGHLIGCMVSLVELQLICRRVWLASKRCLFYTSQRRID